MDGTARVSVPLTDARIDYIASAEVDIGAVELIYEVDPSEDIVDVDFEIVNDS
jgi:hypothetical protein